MKLSASSRARRCSVDKNPCSKQFGQGFLVGGHMKLTRWRLNWVILAVPVVLWGCQPKPDPVPQAPETSETPVHPEVRPSAPSLSTLSVVPKFDDAAPQLGVIAPFYTDTVPGRYFLPEIMGGGATWLDFDQDGQLDLYLTNGSRFELGSGPPPRGNWLYRNREGLPWQLVDAPLGAGDTGYGQGSAAGDFNADGFPDLYVGNVGPNALYVNEGDGTFSLDSNAPILADPAWTSSVMWIDLNRDGWLDLYVTNYLQMTLADRKLCEYEKRPGYCGPGQYSAAPDHAFVNRGDGTFEDATQPLGMTDSIGKGLAILGADFNNDRVPEVYVANDMTVNFLYTLKPQVAGAPREYSEAAAVGGVAQSGEGMNEASMGISCADFDNDGLPDLYLTHYYNMQNTLYKNHGDLQFEDVSRRTQAAQTGYPFLGFGTVPIDFDSDGFLDLFITNGHVLGPAVQPDRMTPQMLHNLQGKSFADITVQLDGYFQKKWLGRGAASADFDNDGDLDIVVTHLDEPAAILRNSTSSPTGFIGLELRAADRMTPCGTQVTITSSHGQQSRSVMLGGSYLSSSDTRLLFPVDRSDGKVDVRIEWTSGAVEQLTGLATNRYWHLAEGTQPW